MPNQAIRTNAAPAAIGPYSQGVQAGSTVYVSGQLPIDPATGASPSPGRLPGGGAAQRRQGGN